LKKFLLNLDIKNFYVNNKQNQIGKNHIFFSSSIRMKNYFLHVEKEKNFDQSEINITSSLKNIRNNASDSNNSLVIEKINKSFINKNIVDVLDGVYLNNLSFNELKNDKLKTNENENKKDNQIGISDLNLRFFISKNFLKEKIHLNKYYIIYEKLNVIRQDEKTNKIMRNLKIDYFEEKNDSNNNIAIIARDIDFDIVEKNLKMINADYVKIDKGKYYILSIFEN
jgi:hypothetical protein